MPSMRVELVWKAGPSAIEALKHVVDTTFKMELQPGGHQQYPSLEFTYPEADALLGNALRTAVGIQRAIAKKYGIKPNIFINGSEIHDIVIRLEQEVLGAAQDLKKTRSFFGDKRFAAIRARLTHAVRTAVQ